VARRRAWGQILSSAGRMYLGHARLFLGIGLLFIPLGAVISAVQALVLGGFGHDPPGLGARAAVVDLLR